MLPIFNIFELGVKEGKKNAYVAVGENNITKSVLNDKGTLGMYLVGSGKRKSQYDLYI